MTTIHLNHQAAICVDQLKGRFWRTKRAGGASHSAIPTRTNKPKTLRLRLILACRAHIRAWQKNSGAEQALQRHQSIPTCRRVRKNTSDAARDLEQIRSGKILPKNWSGASQDRAQSERPSEKTAVPYPSSETASPMHARDRRLYVILAWSAIPAALIVGCYIAWGSSQLPDAWAIAGIAVGLLAMAGATIYALKKKPPSPRYPGPIMIAVAALTWVLIGWQTWMFFHSSTGVSPEKWAALTPSQTEALASRARFIPAEDIVVALRNS